MATESSSPVHARRQRRGRSIFGWLAALLVVFPLLGWAGELVEVTVTEPYIELRTGPGRGYPVFYVAERGETVQILKRRTDWFKVRTERQREGWVSREQMERIVTAEGVKQDLQDAVLEDFRHKRVEAGFAAGVFKGDPVVSFQAGYLLTDNLIAEMSVSQVSGAFSGSRLFFGNLTLQPSTDSRFVPFFTIGGGLFENRNRATLIGTTNAVDSAAADAGIGFRYYLTRNFLLRFDYRQYLSLTSVQKNDRYDEELVGLSFFF